MNKRWYEYWLKKASDLDRTGAKIQAILCLMKAEKHTGDPEELKYLNIWKNRLKREGVKP